MKAYAGYVSHLEKLCEGIVFGSIPKDDVSVISALNGQPARKLQQLVSYEARRESGAFFSGGFLANETTQLIDSKLLGCQHKIIDPACGAGDLLVDVAKNITITEDFENTMSSWGNIFYGSDLHHEFVMATKARLALTALHKGAALPQRFKGIGTYFKNIKQGCGVTTADIGMDFNYVVMNPPYNLVDTPKGCVWSSGKTNYAAVFFHDYVVKSNVGTRIIAILPEVLRSGARYERWRRIVSKKMLVNKITALGQFEPSIDVNVFLIDALIVNNNDSTLNWSYPVTNNCSTISSMFDLSIGTVVDYRDSHDGPTVPYLISKDLPKWSIVSHVSHSRRYSRKIIPSPFVVIRRTSRPDDLFRAVSTIINVDSSVAVDNHLIVLQPKDKSLETCQALLNMLSTKWANDWLNERIRCRHLTISSIAEIPWRKV